MTKREGDDVIQLLIDTGVLTAEDGAAIQSVQTENIMQHMRNHGVVMPAEEARVHAMLTILTDGGSRTQRLQAKIQLVSVITNNVHRKLDRQGTRVREQRERITGDTFPMVARLAKTPK